jgi:hypothetical protein
MKLDLTKSYHLLCDFGQVRVPSLSLNFPIYKTYLLLGVVVRTCNPNTQESESGRL